MDHQDSQVLFLIGLSEKLNILSQDIYSLRESIISDADICFVPDMDKTIQKIKTDYFKRETILNQQIVNQRG